MATEFLDRSAWTTEPKPAGAHLLDAPDVEGFAVHWPGDSGSIGTDQAAIIRRLQGEWRFHTRPASQGGRGWSDIAYQFAVDQAGRVWELRGVTHRSGANGDADVNRRFGAITCLVGAKDTPSPALLQAVRDWRLRIWLPAFPHATKVVGHRDIRPDPTDCPGPLLIAHVRDGTFTTTTDLGTTGLGTTDLGDDMPTADEVRQIVQDVITKTVVVSTDAAREPDADLRGKTLPGLVLTAARRAGSAAAIGAIAARTQPNVDETALAAHLAPLLAPLLSGGQVMRQWSDDEIRAVASAVADEQARRLTA